MTRRIRRGGATAVVLAAVSMALAAAALAPAQAGAATPHVYSFAITGSGTNALWAPVGVAVDNSSGPSAHSVYVTDPGERRVEKFDPEGGFILMFGKGVNKTTGADVCTAASGNVCGAGGEASPSGVPAGAFREPDYIAVDGSGGSSAGDVYVGDMGTASVSKFDSSGDLIESWASGGRLELTGGGLLGIAVGSGGNLIVLAYDSEHNDGEMFEYDPGGALLAQSNPVEWGVFGMAVDSAGNRYVAKDFSVAKFGPGGAALGNTPTDYHAAGLAVDPSDGDLYVSVSQQGIRRYPAGCSMPCKPVATFGQGYLREAFRTGVAVDASDHVVYVAAEGSRGVAVFVPPGVAPEATTGWSAVASQRVIRVDGSVDPAGAGAITGCHFEYVDSQAFYSSNFIYAKTAPCVPATPYGGPQQVSALLSDLDGGTDYRYRLVAVNSNGLRTGLTESFRTDTMIESFTGSAEAVGQNSAVVSGRVLPGRSAAVTVCFFEYVERKYLLSSGFQTARWAPCEPAPPFTAETRVTAQLPRLSPGTTYDYRLMSWDFAGISNGGERSFTSLSPVLAPIDPIEPEEDVERERGRHPPRKVHCLKKACSRDFTASAELRKWISPSFPPEYGWLFSIYKDSKSLAHTRPAGGCISTFTGRGMIATLNGCRGRFKLTYIGKGDFSIRWRVFEFCRCGDNAKRPQRSMLRAVSTTVSSNGRVVQPRVSRAFSLE